MTVLLIILNFLIINQISFYFLVTIVIFVVIFYLKSIIFYLFSLFFIFLLHINLGFYFFFHDLVVILLWHMVVSFRYDVCLLLLRYDVYLFEDNLDKQNISYQ